MPIKLALDCQMLQKQWSKQEETFHLEQARLRSKIRIKDGRAKPIDLLARYLDILQV